METFCRGDVMCGNVLYVRQNFYLRKLHKLIKEKKKTLKSSTVLYCISLMYFTFSHCYFCCNEARLND
jgi:hypothetical protein